MSPNLLQSPAPLQLIQWIADPVGYMKTASERYGDVFTAKIGLNVGDLVFINHPEGIQQLLSQDRQFSARGSVNQSLLPLVGDYSVIMLNGDRHRQKRQLLLPLHGDRMRAYGELICNLAQKVVAQIPVGKPFVARTAMQRTRVPNSLRHPSGSRSEKNRNSFRFALSGINPNEFGFAPRAPLAPVALLGETPRPHWTADPAGTRFQQESGSAFRTHRELSVEISLQVILEAVFGLHEGERPQQLKSLMAQMTEIFRSPFTSSFLFFRFLQPDFGSWSPWGRFKQQQQQIDELLYAEIAARRDRPDPTRTDILSLLMSARDEDGHPLSDRELRDELMTLLFAGHDTTATAMAWALYWVHHLPAVKEKLLQELITLKELDPVSISRLPYLTAVCQETLRIHPVGMLTFPRVVQEPVELLGYDLEPGTVVVGCIYLVHQREDLYPNPQEFKPERFLERKFTSSEFLPFGGGARRCIGEALAQYEMKLVLATLSQYELALADKQPEQPRRRGVTLAPARGVNMVVKEK